MLKQKNSKKQGDVGLGIAIGWFVANGYTVSIPLTDSQDYDLIVDKDGIKRVQVKTTTYIQNGYYSANLSVKGGNQTYSTIKKFDPSKIELLFVVVGDGSKFLIPTTEVHCVHNISLGKKYDKFRV